MAQDPGPIKSATFIDLVATRRRRGYGYHHDSREFDGSFTVQDDGSYAIGDLPTGTYRLCVACPMARRPFQAIRGSHSQPIRQLLSQLRNTSGISTSILLVEARSLATSLTGIRASRSRA
jgi:hypothetical protein